MFVHKPKFHLSWFFQPKTAKVMADAPNPDLFDFFLLEREEKYSTDTAAAPNNINIDDTISDSSSITSNRDPQTVDVWQDIATALNNWTQRILDVESRCNNKAASFRQTIEIFINRYIKCLHLTTK